MTDTSDLAVFHGMSLGQIVTGGGVWTGVIAGVGYWLRSRVPMRKMRIKADESLRAELLLKLKEVETASADRIERLEDRLETQRREYEGKIEHQRIEYEARIAVKDAKFDKEIGIMRHRANNIQQCFDSMLMLIKAAPSKAPEHVAAIEQMRANQKIEEAAEKGEYADDKIARASIPLV